MPARCLRAAPSTSSRAESVAAQHVLLGARGGGRLLHSITHRECGDKGRLI
jgi:hypothetical protein